MFKSKEGWKLETGEGRDIKSEEWRLLKRGERGESDERASTEKEITWKRRRRESLNIKKEIKIWFRNLDLEINRRLTE